MQVPQKYRFLVTIEALEPDILQRILAKNPDVRIYDPTSDTPSNRDARTRSASDIKQLEHSTRLTPRQADIVPLLLLGLTNKEIARCLDISHFTVRVHVSRILLNFGVSGRQDLQILLRSHLQ